MSHRNCRPKSAATSTLKRGRKPTYTPAQVRFIQRKLAKTLGDVFRGMARSL